MRSLPNIFKNFLRPTATKYVLPDADEIQLEEDVPVIPFSAEKGDGRQDLLNVIFAAVQPN